MERGGEGEIERGGDCCAERIVMVAHVLCHAWLQGVAEVVRLRPELSRVLLPRID
jgi:hypothetical protein